MYRPYNVFLSCIILPSFFVLVSKSILFNYFVYRLKPEKLEKELKQFSESAKKRKGEKINLKEFAEYLSVPVMEKLEDLFALFDEVMCCSCLFKNICKNETILIDFFHLIMNVTKCI